MRSLVCAFALLVPFAVALEDPAEPGSMAVVKTEYNFGDEVFRPSDLPAGPDFPQGVEVRASVHHPADLSAGPLPLIVFMHGAHFTCYADTEDIGFEWPCTEGRQSIPSFAGYDYIAERLASHGFIVISVSANGINSFNNYVEDYGMLARAELIQYHLRLWEKFNAVGAAPFGEQFVDKVDLSNIGAMGHSRGGEGLVRHYLLNEQQGSPFGIRALFAVAPTDFSRNVATRVPLAVMLPYCDGDVSDLQGVHYYDDARYAVSGDLTRKHTLLVRGANHNFFNTTWTPAEFAPGSVDDWLEYEYFYSDYGEFEVDPDSHCGVFAGSGRLTEVQQRRIAQTYITAFFRAYVGDQSRFVPLLTGEISADWGPRDASVLLSSHAPHNQRLRLDINRLQRSRDLRKNALNGNVRTNSLIAYELCGGNSRNEQCLEYFEEDKRQSHTARSFNAEDAKGLSQLKLEWEEMTASYVNRLPRKARDISSFSTLTLRASIDTDVSEPDMAQDFSVTLTDGTGVTESFQVSDFSQALAYPPGDYYDVFPRIVLNSLRIPLAAYTLVDLHDIHSVAFDFDVNSSGGLLVADIGFSTAYTCDADNPDAIVGTDAADLLIGTPGDDIIIGLNGNDVILGAGGNDCIAAGGGNDIIITDHGADRLFGGTGNDVIYGRGNHDMVIAGSGDDVVMGGAGNDYIQGDAGNDSLLGGRGSDVILAGVGRDRIIGGRGNDRIDGGPGDDKVKAGKGNNICDGAEAASDCQSAARGKSN